jgi:hypothetical protein
MVVAGKPRMVLRVGLACFGTLGSYKVLMRMWRQATTLPE